LWGGLTIEIR